MATVEGVAFCVQLGYCSVLYNYIDALSVAFVYIASYVVLIAVTFVKISKSGCQGKFTRYQFFTLLGLYLADEL